MIKTEINFKINAPNLDIQDHLMTIANKLFIPALKYYIDVETDIQEKGYPPLAEATVKKKQRQGLSKKILQATGRLRNSFYAIPHGKNKVVITLSADRKEIGNILQNEGVVSKKYGLRFFNFFGVNTRMENEAVKYMRAKIAEAIRNAGLK